MITPLHALLVAEAPAEHVLDSLRRSGYDPRPHYVLTPEALGAALIQRPWDIVVVHHSVATLTAWEALGWLRRQHVHTPCLVVADELEEGEVVDLIGSGADDVILTAHLARIGSSTAKALRRRREATALRDDEAGVPTDPGFQALAEHMPVGLYRSTEDGRILYANPALARILGRDSVDELLGSEVVKTLSYPRQSFVDRIAEDGSVRDLEACWQRASGETVYTRENTRAVRDEDGALLYYEGTMEDITEERTALLNEQRRVDQLEAIVRFSAAVDVAQSSEALHQAIVRAVEETLQADAAVLVQREDGRFEIRAWSETISAEDIRLCTEAEVWSSYPAHTQPLLLRDEQRIPDHVLVEPLRRFMREAGLRALGSFPLLYRGEPLGMVVTFFRQPHTFTEGELRIAETLAWHIAVALSRWQAECALRGSELRYRAISELAADYAYSMRIGSGGGAEFEWATKAFERISGYTPEEVAGPDGLLQIVHEDDRPFVQAELRRLLDGHTIDLEVRIRTKSGAERWVSNRSRPVRDDRGRVTHVYSSGQDISERKRFETEIIVAREQAEEMARLKSAFLTNMSHEIRTPLTGILGFAGVLAEEVDDRHREFVQLIEKSGKRLLDTLNSVLDLAQLESDSVSVATAPLDVVEEVEQVVTLLSPLAEEKQITLKLEVERPEVVASLDGTCLNRILHNLIGNAIKFTECGGIHVLIRPEGDRVQIHVADTGIGIDPEFLPHLFDEFKQESTGQGRSHEGSGLGLAITRKLVELMGGTIRVESTKGAGSTFYLDFPRLLPATGASGDGQVDPRPEAYPDLDLSAYEPWFDGHAADAEAAAPVEPAGDLPREHEVEQESRDEPQHAPPAGYALREETLVLDEGPSFEELPSGAETLHLAEMLDEPAMPEQPTGADPPLTLDPVELTFDPVEPVAFMLDLASPARPAEGEEAVEAVAEESTGEAAYGFAEEGASEPDLPGDAQGGSGAPPSAVLVVEESDETRLLIRRVLEGSYEVESVADARTALQRMASRAYDALLLDINLGGRKTGMDILRVARALPGYEDVVAVALTAYARSSDDERLLEEGFDHFVSKPFTRRALLDAIAAGRTKSITRS